ncbi:MAG: dienelactone hydrolase family protein [Pseudobacteriovorax sp.]|nr:dienelactone hydrolase family protein [Pseudobacteriovorax sp.]
MVGLGFSSTFVHAKNAVAKETKIELAWGESIVEYEIDAETYLSRWVPSMKPSDETLLMFPNWLGPDTQASVDKARKLALRGYNVFLVDVYGVSTRPQNPEEAAAASGALRGDRDQLRLRAQVALSQLKSTNKGTDTITAIGFCFGGTASLELARDGAELNGFVSFHGNLDSPNPDDAKNIKAPVLILNGFDDPIVPQAQIRAFEAEMTNAGVDWTLINYSQTVHSFTDPTANTPGFAEYNPRSARRAFAAMDQFIEDIN